jgi:tRNA(His) 5'-end guanylyltransferase
MKFDEMEKKMRVYEDNMSHAILPGLFMVARLDGRGFTRLTKETCGFEAPYDDRFRDYMVQTVKHLMDCGFRIVYGYTQSDEISLLFHKDEETFARKVRKYLSVLAGEASSSFSLLLGTNAVFDCRVIPLPNVELVQDYFLWRQEDAHRNALNSHCYWHLRKEGMSAVEATEELSGKSVSYKNELLFSKGLNFDKLPLWQKRGIGVYWQDCEIEGYNPVKQEKESAIRRGLFVDDSLPLGQEYAKMISGFCLS